MLEPWRVQAARLAAFTARSHTVIWFQLAKFRLTSLRSCILAEAVRRNRRDSDEPGPPSGEFRLHALTEKQSCRRVATS